jgi:hypothetical protein
MTPFGLTTIVDLAPRLVLPFSPTTALWLQAMGLFVVAGLGVLHAVLRARAEEPVLATARRPARVIPLRPAEKRAA